MIKIALTLKKDVCYFKNTKTLRIVLSILYNWILNCSILLLKSLRASSSAFPGSTSTVQHCFIIPPFRLLLERSTQNSLFFNSFHPPPTHSTRYSIAPSSLVSFRQRTKESIGRDLCSIHIKCSHWNAVWCLIRVVYSKVVVDSVSLSSWLHMWAKMCKVFHLFSWSLSSPLFLGQCWHWWLPHLGSTYP